MGLDISYTMRFRLRNEWSQDKEIIWRGATPLPEIIELEANDISVAEWRLLMHLSQLYGSLEAKDFLDYTSHTIVSLRKVAAVREVIHAWYGYSREN